MLTQVGFDIVDFRQDVGVVEFKRAVREFLAQAANSDIAVVYYSGHGMEFDGSNYLIPVDAKLASTFDVDDETVSLERILASTEQVRKLSLIILDACRDNPFLRGTRSFVATRAISSGLTGVAPTAANTLVAYAAKAGSVSFDGVGPNSPFTTALIKHLAEPGLDIRIALGKVRDEVMTETGGRQEPFVYGSLGGENVSLVPAKSIGDAVTASLAGGATPEALDYQLAERVGSLEAWRAFVDAHPKGYYSKLALAQIAKLSAAPSSAAPAPTKSPAPTNSKSPAPATVATPGAADQAPAVFASREDLCKQDKDTLSHLRANPLAEDVGRFALQTEVRGTPPAGYEVDGKRRRATVAANQVGRGRRPAAPRSLRQLRLGNGGTYQASRQSRSQGGPSLRRQPHLRGAEAAGAEAAGKPGSIVKAWLNS